MLLKIHTGTLTHSHSTDAGFDIHSDIDITISPYDYASVDTNLRITLPPQTLAFVKPRSGSSFGSHIETGAGVIDNDYSGEIKVKLYNFGSDPFRIKKGQRIAQLVVLHRPIIAVEHSPEAEFNGPSTDERGTKGFGSTDRNTDNESDTKNEPQLDSSSFNLALDAGFVPDQLG